MGIQEYLEKCRELTAFCTQNGWIANDTVRYDVLYHEPGSLVAAVEFEEVIMEGSGCVAGHVPCYGRMRLHVDSDGNITGGEAL